MCPDPHYAKTAAGFASAFAILKEEVHAARRPVHAPVAGREIPVSASALLDARKKCVETKRIGEAVRRRIGGSHGGVWPASHESCRPIPIPSIGT